MRLIELVDPDNWIAWEWDLRGYPFPAASENERQAMLLILDPHPELKTRIGLWLDAIREEGRANPNARVADVLTAERAQELWDQSRVENLS